MSLVQHICKFFALDVVFRTYSFICLLLFCRNRSFCAFLRCFNLSILRANLASTEKSAAGKVVLTFPSLTTPCRTNEQCFQRFHRARLLQVKCAKSASISSSTISSSACGRRRFVRKLFLLSVEVMLQPYSCFGKFQLNTKSENCHKETSRQFVGMH